jgi:hypothetical protein
VDQWTSFSEPGRFPLVLKQIVAGSRLNKVLIDGGSGLNVMEARVPDLPKGSDIRRFGEVATQIDPASEQHVQNPAIIAPRLLRLSTGVARPTSPKSLILACKSKNTSKNKKECNTIADV